MKSEFFVFLCAFLATTVLSECHAAESDPYIFTTGTSAPPAVILVGATLGNNWDEFPYELMPDYNPTYTFEQLNVTLPLYVTWVMDSVEGPLPVQVNPPQPITSFSWYFSVGNRVVQISQDAFDQGYIACAQGDGLEWPTAGSFPISSGQMNVSDVHGGIGDRTTIVLQFSLDSIFTYIVFVSWDHPGSYFDDHLQTTVNLQPGDTYNRRVVANYLGVPYESFTQVKIVQWASTDIGVVPEAPGPSPRFVDAGDLAYFMTCYGRPIRYGFPGENPPNSPTWQCDLNPFDNATIIGAQDFATLVGDLTESCQLSKPGNSGEVAAIMQWFGIAPTGRMLTVGPNGEASVPEYEIVDWEKNRQAIADPYGYLRNLNSSVALDVPWSLVKRLYR